MLTLGSGVSSDAGKTDAMTLTDFLLGRIAHTIAVARRIQAQAAGEQIGPDDPRAAHLALARIAIADAKAKRRIVELHEPTGDSECSVCSSEGYDRTDDEDDLPARLGDPWPCDTLRLLALPYARNPDYREEWRP